MFARTRPLGLLLVIATGAWAGTPVFAPLSPTTPPGVRRSTGAAVRPGLFETYLSYGGFNGGASALAELVYFRPTTNGWANGTSTIAGRERHGLAYDPVHDVFVIAGGASGLTVYDTVFRINGSTLATSAPPVPATRPSARVDSVLQWIPAWEKFLYFGGRTSVLANNHVGDLWSLDVADGGVTWASVAAPGGPSARGATCNAVDPVSGKLYLFGGEANSNQADTWSWAPDAGWAPLTVSGAVPSARAFSACAWDARINQLVLYGGYTNTFVGGLFSFNPATNVWTSYAPLISPGLLSDAAAAFSPTLGGVVFFGGQTDTGYTNGTWLLLFNSPPVVDAGVDFSIGENVMATLQGSVTDPDGDTTTQSWQQTVGPTVTLSDVSALTPTFTTPRVAAPTPLRFTLTASDGTDMGSDEVIVTVLNTLDDPPLADAGPDQTVSARALVALAGSGSDPNGDAITGYAWSQSGGPVVSLSSTSVAAPTFSAPVEPVDTPLTFSLIVTAGAAMSAPDQVVITVLGSAADAGMIDGGSADAGPGDAGANDAGFPDAGLVDGGLVDAGVSDGGPGDGGAPDAGVNDGGTSDAGDVDAGASDGGQPDAGTSDAGAADAGSADGGDAGSGRYSVGCGCSEVPPASVWWVVGFFAWFARRRHLAAR